MTTSKDPEGASLSRRDALKLTGFAVGGLAVGGALVRAPLTSAESGEECAECTPSCPVDKPGCGWADTQKANQYTYFEQDLAAYPFYPFSKDTPSTIQKLGKDEMRITFMGSSIPNNIRKVQALMSIFVEVGWDDARQMPADNLIFDCGPGVCTNYNAMNVNFGRMDKIFINHLHGDHMNDVTQIYCFGPSSDRLSPLYIFGPGPSGVESPQGYGRRRYDDGTRAYCEHLREMCRWHTESFSFQNTSYTPTVPDNRSLKQKWGLAYEPRPVGKYASPDPDNDGYALIPIELDWRKGGVAYDNKDTGVKVSYYKVIHARQGSIGYKLEFTPPGGTEGVDTLTMIYSSDTKPETLSIENAKNKGKGVDVFIHEMIVPAEIWTMKMGHLTDPSVLKPDAVQRLQNVQNSSHTPQGAFGYLLSQIEPRPRLTVATHFPVADDTVECAWKSVSEHCKIVRGNGVKPAPDEARITWSFDLMVIKVSKDEIVEQKGIVSNFEYSATLQPVPGTKNTPKYHDENGDQDPYAQIDQSTEILPCDCETGECHYRADGY